MPTFAFPVAPANLTIHLLRNWNAPLPDSALQKIHSFGNILDARLSSMPYRSTSELLRTR
jgi:hypothetical protein